MSLVRLWSFFFDGVERELFLREELRRRFVKAETTLFKVRYEMDDKLERPAFLESQQFEWEKVARLVPHVFAHAEAS